MIWRFTLVIRFNPAVLTAFLSILRFRCRRGRPAPGYRPLPLATRLPLSSIQSLRVVSAPRGAIPHASRYAAMIHSGRGTFPFPHTAATGYRRSPHLLLGLDSRTTGSPRGHGPHKGHCPPPATLSLLEPPAPRGSIPAQQHTASAQQVYTGWPEVTQESPLPDAPHTHWATPRHSLPSPPALDTGDPMPRSIYISACPLSTRVLWERRRPAPPPASPSPTTGAPPPMDPHAVSRAPPSRRPGAPYWTLPLRSPPGPAIPANGPRAPRLRALAVWLPTIDGRHSRDTL